MKSHLEREITLIELAPSPYIFVLSICLVYVNMFARFDENPAMTLQDIKETKRNGRMDGSTHRQRENSIPTTNLIKRYRRTDGSTHGQRENSIPTTNKVCGGV